MSTKIQINSLAALERLIGGDTELEIEIRNNIVQEFTKKHLKQIATASVINQAIHSIEEDLIREFFETVKDGYRNKTVLKKDVLTSFKEEMIYRAKEELHLGVNEAMEIVNSKAIIDKALSDACDRILTTLSDSYLEKRLDAMVNAKLKAKLGL